MNGFKKVLTYVIMIAVLALLVLLPRTIGQLSDSESLFDSLLPKKEPYIGMITIWHVVGFRPFTGSLSRWLVSYAEKLEKKHPGVYFDVIALTVSEADKRIANGELPDLISFPAGYISCSMLERLDQDFPYDVSTGCADGSIYAAPYAASCDLVVYYTDEISEGELDKELIAECDHSPEEFKKHDTAFVVTDARQAGDLLRLSEDGRIDNIGICAFASKTDHVQYIAITKNTRLEKLICCEEFIELITSPAVNQTLSSLGLMPFCSNDNVKYEYDFLEKSYALLISDPSGFQGAF